MALLLISAGCGGEDEPPQNLTGDWPGFRNASAGIADAGVATSIELPGDIVWKAPHETEGFSSPIVWADRIFISAEPARLLAFDRASGEKLWDVSIIAEAAPPQAPDAWPWRPPDFAGLAAPTPCTDGRRVYALFGDGVLAAVSVDGEQDWSRRIVVRPESTYGLASSPVLAGNTLVQQIDLEPAESEAGGVELVSFIAGYDGDTGQQLWKIPRPSEDSWTTPLTVGADNDIVLALSSMGLTAYDGARGEQLWNVPGPTGELAASAAMADGVVFVASADDNPGPILAVRLADNPAETPELLWRNDDRDDLPTTASGVSDGEHLWLISGDGDLQCYDAATGERLWTTADREGWSMTFDASPILVGGRLLMVSYNGDLLLLDGPTGEIVTQVELGEKVHATPAVVDGQIIIRGEDHLFCIEPGE